MCLLMTIPADVTFTEKEIRDFYVRNQDGIGVMFHAEGQLQFYKLLPKNGTEAVKFFKRYEGIERAVHWRMRTHGEINLDNCHPYVVQGFSEKDGGFGTHESPLLLMHNGVLFTGNHANTKFSDTWHYVRDYLRPLLAKRPDLAFDPVFVEVISKHIGSGNKFVVMGRGGKMAVFNRSSGVEHKGAWFSNTYAWSAPMVKRTSVGSQWGMYEYDSYDDYHLRKLAKALPAPNAERQPATTTSAATVTKLGRKARRAQAKRQRELYDDVRKGQTDVGKAPVKGRMTNEADVVDLMNELSLGAPKAFMELTEQAIDRAFSAAGATYMWELTERFMYRGQLLTKDYVSAVNDPRTIIRVVDRLRAADRTTFESRAAELSELDDEEVADVVQTLRQIRQETGEDSDGPTLQ